MHYERAPRFPRSKLEGRRLRCAALCRASLRYGGAREEVEWCVRCERTTAEHRQISWRMALYLGGEVSVDANDLSPKEATAMSRDIKYIGMDIYKEAIVIAVLNGSGKLVMETVVETKASSILEFLHGLRGEKGSERGVKRAERASARMPMRALSLLRPNNLRSIFEQSAQSAHRLGVWPGSESHP